MNNQNGNLHKPYNQENLAPKQQMQNYNPNQAKHHQNFNGFNGAHYQQSNMNGGLSHKSGQLDYPIAKFIMKLNIGPNLKMKTVIDLNQLKSIGAIITYISAQMGIPRVEQLQLIGGNTGQIITNIEQLLQNEVVKLVIQSQQNVPNQQQQPMNFNRAQQQNGYPDAPNNNQFKVQQNGHSPQQMNNGNGQNGYHQPHIVQQNRVPSMPSMPGMKKRGRPKKVIGGGPDGYMPPGQMSSFEEQKYQPPNVQPQPDYNGKAMSIERKLKYDKPQQYQQMNGFSDANHNQDHYQINGHPDNKQVFDIRKFDSHQNPLNNGKNYPHQNKDQRNNDQGPQQQNNNILDITKEFIMKQQQKGMIEQIKLLQLPDKVVTDLITKVVQRHKYKIETFATLDLLGLLDGIVNSVLNKYQDSPDCPLSEIQKSMRRLQLLYIAISTLFSMSHNEKLTAGLVKDKMNKITTILTESRVTEKLENSIQNFQMPIGAQNPQLNQLQQQQANIAQQVDFICLFGSIKAYSRFELIQQVLDVASRKGIMLEVDFDNNQMGYLQNVIFRQTNQPQNYLQYKRDLRNQDNLFQYVDHQF
eukprot:403340941